MTSQFQLIIAALFLILANKVTSQTDSTTFNFTAFYPWFRNLTFQGDAHVPSADYSNVYLVRMISDNKPAQNSTGRVLYTPPVAFWVSGRQASFETTFTFVIRTYGSPYIHGDGITFFIAPVDSPIPTGSYGGNFGIFNPLTGLAPSVFAFEYDYYYTGEDAAWDPQNWHIGIDINSRASKNTTRFSTLGGILSEVTATINYDASTRTITAMTTRSSETKSVSYVINLKTILPQQVQVGISGSTGVGVSQPELRSWSFTSTLVGDSTYSIEDNAKNEEEYAKQYV